jgi:hypothetical protein
MNARPSGACGEPGALSGARRVREAIRGNPPVVTPAGRPGSTSLLYPRFSRERLEGRFLGLMADLDGKPEGDNSMPGK